MLKEILMVLSGMESLLTEILLELRNRKEHEPAVQPFTEGASHDYESAVQPFTEGASRDYEPDKWLQDGIDNILGFQAGGKRGKQA